MPPVRTEVALVIAVVSKPPKIEATMRSEKLTKFFIQAAEASSSRSVPQRKSSVAIFCFTHGERRDANNLTEMGTVMHACEGEMVCESINPKIPYFNAPIYLENKVRNP